MPRLSDATRDQRRNRILDAARACVDEHGLEAVSMEMIIARSGMSIGAVYRYFAGKDDIIRAAVLGGTAGVLDALGSLLTQPDPPPPGPFIEAVLTTVLATSTVGGTDLTRVAVHGWSHSRSDQALRTEMRHLQRQLRRAYTEVARRWQVTGAINTAADPKAVGQLMLSITLGYVAQRTLAGDADIHAHAAALDALSTS